MFDKNINLGIFWGNFFIPYYGLMIVIGLIFATLVALFQIRKYNLDLDNFILLSAISGLFAIIGSKFLFLLVSWKQIQFSKLTNLKYLNLISNSGFVFYGGLLGAFLGIFISKKMFKINITDYLRYCTPVIPILHGFGRIGCFLAGCCYGKPFKSAFSITYTHSIIAPNNIPLFPTQLLEALILFFISIFLLIYINKFNQKYAFQIYIFLYAIARFILEFFRYDNYRGIFWGFSTSQFISVFLLLYLLFLNLKKFYINYSYKK